MAAHVRQLFALTVASLLLQTVTSTSRNSTIFAVTVSSRVTGGNEETLCAQIHEPTEPVTLTVSLMVQETATVILEEAVTQDFYRCLTFQVPVVRTRTVATVDVSITGQNVTLNRSTKVHVEPPSFLHIMQTDKPVYRPGQTVQFRIVSMDASFIPVNRVYKVVELQDPNTNRIAQWLDRTVAGGILDLSHPTIPEAVQGTYRITATTDKGEEISHSFDVKEYVLPKFEVTVQLPSVISILDEEATLKICGKYTYGKPVIGSVQAALCRKGIPYSWVIFFPRNLCKTYKLDTDRSGCATQNVNLTFFRLSNTNYVDFLHVDAEMEEFGTGVVLKGSGHADLSFDIRTVTFEDVPAAYRSGIPLEGKVKMVGPDNQPVFNESVYLTADSKEIVLTTDANGMASFSLNTSLWSGDVSLRARSRQLEPRQQYIPNFRWPVYKSDYHRVTEFYSKSRSFLKLMQVDGKLPCDKVASVHAQYIIPGEELENGQEVLHLFCLVMSRGRIVQHGRLPLAVRAGTVNKGEVSVPLLHLTDLAPFAQVLVYTILPTGEAVADSRDYPVQLCFNNKVSLTFPLQQELPAQKTSLNLQAHPGSLCSVRAIDRSVLLLQAEKELSIDSVYSQLPVQRLSGYSYEVDDSDTFPCYFPVLHEEDRRVKRSFNFGGPPDEKNDVHSIFKDVGIKIATNADIKKPFICLMDILYEDTDFLALANVQFPGAVLRQQTETVRTFFPETWIWDLVSVGDNGSVSVEKTVPDTITQWVAGAFCVSSVGFGLSPSTELTAFQPFFVSLTLPYSVIRGEVFTLKATVFNYLSKCIMVTVTLADSDQFTARNCDGCQYSVCVCGEESRTFSWVVTPTALGEVNVKVSAEAQQTDVLCGSEAAAVPDVGRVDTVVRTLLVEAEGTPQSVSHNVLLCPADGPVEKNISLLVPETLVPGSARASVSVVGDLMGRALRNLDKLLAMPYGCGEQNMVLFAPNVFILNYLKSTDQLTADIQDKATRFLESGYQRELSYKHDDGSYSAFGKNDDSGNTWLTSFVMKSFSGARQFIFVDDKHIEDARTWLSAHQEQSGCIRSVGRLLNNGMKGGVSDEVSLTAYITAALLEADGNATDPVIHRCLHCLATALVNCQVDNVYTTALMSYTFTLAGDQDMRSKLLQLLHQRCSARGGTRHWERARPSSTGPDSLEVEMTSYVLLALLSGPTLPDFGLDYSSSIVRWLIEQQNPYGGFSSTQDTVVALQALAKYAALTYSREGSTTVTVTSSGGLNKEFKVDPSNRLLYQEEQLSEASGEFTVTAEGQSCVMAQISMHYNIPPPPDFSAFSISTHTMAKCNATKPQLILFVHVRYEGRREETNMVIVNIKLLSGYVLDPSSLNVLMSDRTVKRVDVDEGFINIYLDGLKQSQLQIHSLTLDEDVSVRNLKPAVVKVYDYYQTSDEAVTEYTSPCAESDEVNQL